MRTRFGWSLAMAALTLGGCTDTVAPTSAANVPTTVDTGLATPFAPTGLLVNPGFPSVGTTEWLEYAQASVVNNFYSSISAEWVVPPAPTAPYTNNQVYFVRPAVVGYSQPYNVRSSIFEPVLQYGVSQAGGGNYWSIASWWCVQGSCAHSTLVMVSPGDLIRGHIIGSCGWTGCVYTVTTSNLTTGQQTVLSPPMENGWQYSHAVGGVIETYDLTSCGHYPANGVFLTNLAVSVAGTPTPQAWQDKAKNPSPSCKFGARSDSVRVNLYHNPSVTATGSGLTADCGITCGGAHIRGITASGGSSITITDNGGHSGTITLTGGATASGGLVASCIGCTPRITAVTSHDGHITVKDNAGHTGVLTISGGKAWGGVVASCGATCSPAYINAVKTANGYITVKDNGGTIDTLFLRP